MSQAICCSPSVISTVVPWWRRAGTWAVDRWHALASADGASTAGRWSAESLGELGQMSPRLLRDIGAPGWMQERSDRAASKAGSVPQTWF